MLWNTSRSSGLRGVCGLLAAEATIETKFRSTQASVFTSSPLQQGELMRRVFIGQMNLDTNLDLSKFVTLGGGLTTRSAEVEKSSSQVFQAGQGWTHT